MKSSDLNISGPVKASPGGPGGDKSLSAGQALLLFFINWQGILQFQRIHPVGPGGESIGRVFFNFENISTEPAARRHFRNCHGSMWSRCDCHAPACMNIR